MGADGIYRHVEYTADELGFRARIKTSEHGMVNENPANVYIDANPISVPLSRVQPKKFDGRAYEDKISRDNQISSFTTLPNILDENFKDETTPNSNVKINFQGVLVPNSYGYRQKNDRNLNIGRSSSEDINKHNLRTPLNYDNKRSNGNLSRKLENFKEKDINHNAKTTQAIGFIEATLSSEDGQFHYKSNPLKFDDDLESANKPLGQRIININKQINVKDFIDNQPYLSIDNRNDDLDYKLTEERGGHQSDKTNYSNQTNLNNGDKSFKGTIEPSKVYVSGGPIYVTRNSMKQQPFATDTSEEGQRFIDQEDKTFNNREDQQTNVFYGENFVNQFQRVNKSQIDQVLKPLDIKLKKKKIYNLPNTKIDNKKKTLLPYKLLPLPPPKSTIKSTFFTSQHPIEQKIVPNTKLDKDQHEESPPSKTSFQNSQRSKLHLILNPPKIQKHPVNKHSDLTIQPFKGFSQFHTFNTQQDNQNQPKSNKTIYDQIKPIEQQKQQNTLQTLKNWYQSKYNVTYRPEINIDTKRINLLENQKSKTSDISRPTLYKVTPIPPSDFDEQKNIQIPSPTFTTEQSTTEQAKYGTRLIRPTSQQNNKVNEDFQMGIRRQGDIMNKRAEINEDTQDYVNEKDYNENEKDNNENETDSYGNHEESSEKYQIQINLDTKSNSNSDKTQELTSHSTQTTETSSMLPLSLVNQALSLTNWHKYDHFDNSDW